MLVERGVLCLDVIGSAGSRRGDLFLIFLWLSETWDCQISALPPHFSSHWLISPLTWWPRKRRWQRLSFAEISDSLGGKKEVSQVDKYAEILGLCVLCVSWPVQRQHMLHFCHPVFLMPILEKRSEGLQKRFAVGFKLCEKQTEPCGNVSTESVVTKWASMSPDGSSYGTISIIVSSNKSSAVCLLLLNICFTLRWKTGLSWRWKGTDRGR